MRNAGVSGRRQIAALVLIAALAVQSVVAAEDADARAVPSNIEQYIGSGVSVQTSGGGSFQGTLLGVQADRVEILLSDGQILQIARDALAAFSTVDSSGGSRSFYEDSASNRLVVMPTAFPMDPGEFQIADQEIAAVTGSYGINEWLSVWGGLSIPGALFSLRASLQITDRVGASLGSFVGASWFELEMGPLVLPYGLLSFGEADNNVTVGSGFMMTFSDGFSIPGAVFAIGGKRTLTATTAVVTENWVVWAERSRWDEATMVEQTFWSFVPYVIAPSAVFRIASNRLSWDIGAVVPFIIDGSPADGYRVGNTVIPIPVLSVTYRVR